jgi:Kef-type K+ transport system membrane component KefB
MSGLSVPPVSDAAQLLRALLTLLVAVWALSALCRRLHQPPVVGEILAGICLGPSLFGRFAPALHDYLLPESVSPQLATLSQIGVLLFMFLVGLELDLSQVRQRARVTIAISHASIVVPLLLGVIAAIWLEPRYGGGLVSLPIFALFLGVALAVTAFPVLARILTDNGLSRTSMGMLALTCAAVDDVSAWCLLALLVGLVKGSPWAVVSTCGLTLAFMLFLLRVVGPIVSRRARAMGEHVPRGALLVVVLGLIGCALVTELIGIHAIFGAFSLGAILPHDSALAVSLRRKLHDVCVVLLMPAFYALVGMRTRIDLISGAAAWLTCGMIIAIASLGKFGGSYAAARLVGVPRSDAAAIGILMNTRGLMELVVLDLGLSLGVLSAPLFAMMVIMAIATTALANPLLKLVRGWNAVPSTTTNLAEEAT